VVAHDVADQEAEGPWVASRQYWESLRHDTPGTHASEAGKSKTECPAAEADRWGLPEDIGCLLKNGLQAHAVIATVPDPIHSHLAPEFDRTLDALIGAASDNGYLASYSWLPWKTPADKESDGLDALLRSKTREDATAAEKAARSAAEEPGLLIFDKRSTSGETPTVLFVFLVGEMPADGLNAEQLKKALTYELQLRSSLGAGEKAIGGEDFATDQEGRLRVIGPLYSGSAMSLIQTIDTVLEDPSLNKAPMQVQTVRMVGATQTEAARRILNRCPTQEEQLCVPHQYFSFASSAEIQGVLDLVQQSGYDSGRTLELREDGTFFGTSVGGAITKGSQMRAVSFPRDISLLRNSHKDEQSGSESGETGTPSPYLRLTTRDQGSQDTLPEFSTDVTPLSQEAQLMSISHGMTQLHADFAYIAASNPMDTLFLAKSLHRSNPDTRLVMEPDLLLQREGDDAAYIGSLSVTPYPLVWAARSAEAPGQLRTFATAAMEAYYNAASFTLGSMAVAKTSYERGHGDGHPPILYGYNRAPRPSDGRVQPPLWLTAVGTDGYYPIAMLTIDSKLPAEPQNKHNQARTVYPSHVWQAVCVLIGLGCILHIVALFSATYSSPQTCDLDINQNCMRHRRALYGQVGGAVLFLMSAVAAIPAAVFLHYGRVLRLDYVDVGLGMFVLLLGIAAWIIAIWKTVGGVQWDGGTPATLFNLSEKRLCAVLYWGAIAATFALAGLWFVLCKQSPTRSLGAFFSYRCLHPLSGVSPIAPALLLLWGWFFWALLHARRLRLTPRSRPRLPDKNDLQKMPCASYSSALPDLFVSDDRIRSGLLEDTTCLMISRRVLQRILPKQHAIWLDRLLMLIIAALTGIWIGFSPVRSLEHLGLRLGPTALYELFIGLLLVPLLVIVMCAASRLFLVAASLRNQLLERLERMPLRHAFTRLQGFHWVSMLRESGQLERWRDMARSTEGIRQILNDPGLPAACRAGDLHKQKDALEAEVRLLEDHVKALHDGVPPPDPARQACQYVEEIEKKYAACAESILCCILLPHWTRRRHDVLQSLLEPPRPAGEPNVVLLAEEFLAMRYMALIRGILAQMRYLLTFITAALVLIMLALNSYPFQPKQEIDWFVTGFFLCFSAGIVLVFAQMHRNPLLSRITDKAAHELGADFYLRVAMFGAVPMITWLATQYPSIGSTLYGLLKPGLDVMK
jgi:hypothetical protein